MKSDGKYLEELVGFIEQQLLPMGFTVTFNECTRDEDGFQTAELDIVIRGSVGDTPIYWLIECRDRPGTGAVGISWIEQLKGRWIRLGFSKVSAVSTTGFSKVASDWAREWGIELREVRSLSKEAFADLLLTSKLEVFHRDSYILGFYVVFKDDESDEAKNLAHETLQRSLDVGFENPAILSTVDPYGRASLCEMLNDSVSKNISLFDDVLPGVPKDFWTKWNTGATHDDVLGVETSLGRVKVTQLDIHFELRVTAEVVPLSSSALYRHLDAAAPISQTYEFVVPNFMGKRVAVEVLTLKSTDETYVAMRETSKQAEGK